MSQIVFAAISPHPPLILPSVGTEHDRLQVKSTIDSLEKLGERLRKKNPDSIIISSPHPDWGFEVPLFFLAKDFKGEVKKYLMGMEEPASYFQEGKRIYGELERDKKYALIASGDMSHVLKEEGPYGFHEQGPAFDKALIDYLKEKNVAAILKLDERFPEAAECGLRSFAFMLGIIEAFCGEEPRKNWTTEVLSYEGTFGVGYLAAEIKII